MKGAFMYKVIINNKIYSYNEKKTLEEIAKELNVECYVAKVNNRLRELTFYLNFDCEVEFLDLNENEAVRVYQTTLRYIIAMALKRIDEKATLTFNDYVSRSFIGILNNTKYNFNSKYLEDIRDDPNFANSSRSNESSHSSLKTVMSSTIRNSSKLAKLQFSTYPYLCNSLIAKL